jgi:hypothetical protein
MLVCMSSSSLPLLPNIRKYQCLGRVGRVLRLLYNSRVSIRLICVRTGDTYLLIYICFPTVNCPNTVSAQLHVDIAELH